jgi:hypothetical protein
LKNNKKKGYNLAKFSKNNNELPDEGEKKQSIQRASPEESAYITCE